MEVLVTMQLLKKNLKRIAAVGIGAAMLGMTMSGALAATYTLGDYPTPFTGKDTVLVVGAAAGDADNAAMEDVAFGLGTVKTTTLGTTGTTLEFDDGELKDVQLGTALNDASAFGNALDDTDDVGLTDGELNINIGSDKDYDFHEEIGFSGDAKITTALGQLDKDFKDQVVVVLPDEAMSYSYVFEDSIDSGNYIAESTSDNDIDLVFMGKDMTIRGGTNTSITAVVGDKLTLNAGESVKVGTHTVKFIKATASKALVEIDGESFTKAEGSSIDKKGVEIYVDSVFDEEDPTKESAVLIIGTNAIKTYSNGNAYYDEDETHYLWKWNLSALNFSTPSLGVTLAEDLDDATDPLHSKITELGLTKGDKAYLAVGDYLCLPHKYACVVFDSIEGDMSPKDLTFSAKQEREDLYNAAGTTELYDNVYGLRITSVYGENKGLLVNSDKTDKAFVYFNKTNNQTWVFKYDKDTGVYVNSTVGGLFNDSAFDAIFAVDYGDFDRDVYMRYSTLGAAAGATTANFTIGFSGPNDANSLNITGIFDSTNGLYYLGEAQGRDTSSYFYYGSTAIDDYDNNVRTEDGVLVYDPESNVDKDMAKFALPNDNEFKINLKVAMPKGASSSTTTSTSYTKMKDTEVLDTLTSYNVITVGGPAVNKVTAKLMGKEFPATGATSGITEGKALLELLPNGEKWALVVAGWEKENTLAAASLLKNYKDQTFGTKATVVVSGTSASGVTFE
jgi:hypothetical protein